MHYVTVHTGMDIYIYSYILTVWIPSHVGVSGNESLKECYV